MCERMPWRFSNPRKRCFYSPIGYGFLVEIANHKNSELGHNMAAPLTLCPVPPPQGPSPFCFLKHNHFCQINFTHSPTFWAARVWNDQCIQRKNYNSCIAEQNPMENVHFHTVWPQGPYRRPREFHSRRLGWKSDQVNIRLRHAW